MTRFAIVLGALSALGPFAIDMYLPAMPAMAGALHASPGQVQATLMSFFIGLAAGQLFFGPVSDRLGRRGPIYFGLGLFVASSVVSALAPSVEWLIAARLVQGLAASVGFVVGNAVIRDLHSGPEAARLFALRFLVLGVSPVISPFVGSAIIVAGSWRLIFWAATAIGVGLILLTMALLPETHPRSARAQGERGMSTRAYLHVLTDRRFMALAVAGAFGQGAFFAYLSGSSFVFIQDLGLSPFMYSVVFGVNAVGLVGGAQVAPNLMRKLGPERLILLGSGVQAVVVTILLVAGLVHQATLWVLVPTLFIAIAAFGQVGAPASVLALSNHQRTSGTASAVLGSMQIGSGALVSGVVAALANGTSMPMIGAIAACGIASFLLYVLAVRRGPEPVEAAG